MQAIRCISVGLPVRSGHVLVLDGSDRVKNESFHRAIGGGIEFGETAEEALRREFAEELGVTLTDVRLLDVVENIFDYEGHPGHEIAFVYSVASPQLDVIPLTARLHVLDEGSPVGWILLAAADRPLYPEGVDRLLQAMTTA